VFCRRTETLVIRTILLQSIVTLAILTLHGCARPQAAGVERLGVMPIENLSSDAQLDWPSRAAAAVVAYDLAGARNIFAKQVDSLSAAQSMQASRVLQGYFFERNGRIGIRATLEELVNSRAVENFEIDGPASAGFLPVANELARRLSPNARKFGTGNENAFRFYGQALAARDSQDAQRALEQATNADPRFAAGFLDRAKLLAETGDRERARQMVEAGERANPDPMERANLEYVAASATGDAAGRIRALESLTQATPANANIFVELAEMRFRRREFQPAAMEYRAAARLDPDDPQIWNQLGYTLAWAKDWSGARQALAQYQKLSPEDPNALDSEGEVSYMRGDFKTAQEYFERAAAKNPSEWVKAAEARLMLGDREAADALLAKSGASGYQMAQWNFLTGRRKEGLAQMEKLASESEGDRQALAFSQLAIWKLEMGDNKAAADLANEAAMRARSPQAHRIAGLCQHITSGGAGDALALLFAKRFQEAIPLLLAGYAETNPSADGQLRTLLAWAYVETGAIDKAASLMDPYPLPLSSGEPLFASLVFPRYLSLRGIILRHEGKIDEAKKSFELYSKYQGPPESNATK
jgi:Flp pilus assembly protein TadD